MQYQRKKISNKHAKAPKTNGNGKFSSLSNKHMGELANLYSAISGRADLAQRLGQSFKDRRDMYKNLGYEKNLQFSDYWDVYQRQDIAKRVIDVPVESSWRKLPDIVEDEGEETAFEIRWKEVIDNVNVFHYMARIDKLSGIGEYGVLLLGFDDGKDLEEPVEKANELTYIRPYKENNASIKTYVEDTKDPRYGLPELYSLNISVVETTGNTSETRSMLVHWSRILHVADDLMENDVIGTPRLKNVFNRLMDLEKVVGGGSEMFWRGAFPGLAFILDSDAEEDVDQTSSNLEDQISAYIHDMQRTLKLQGMEVQNLAPNIHDPHNAFEVLITIIAAGRGIPKRILMGTERGELASSQDETAWNKKTEERRESFCIPMIIRPFVDRLILVGVLPPVKEYDVKFPDISVPTEQEKAAVAKTKTEAIAAYANSIDASMVVPLRIYLRDILEFEEEVIEEIQGEVNEQIEEDREEEEEIRVRDEDREDVIRKEGADLEREKIKV